LPEPDLALLEDAAREAGAIALRHFGSPAGVREKPGGHGPVTEADLEVDRMLRARLTAARPGYGWLSEESEDGPARLAAERVFIVDPIDGTRNFVSGGKAWAHSLAVAENGRVVAGVVFLPRLERLFTAAAGEGAHVDGAAIRPSPRSELDGAQVLTGAAQMDPAHWPGGVPRVERHFRPSLAYRLCLVAEGRFDAMLTFRDAWEWDVAAGALIANEAGATVTDRTGAPPVFNNPSPLLPGLIAAAPALHPEIMRRTSAQPTSLR
jgi:myo-inositol-1(or 4)-monophosphatase